MNRRRTQQSDEFVPVRGIEASLDGPGRIGRAWVAALASLCLAACGGEDEPEPEPTPWHVVHADLPGALMSVWGSGANDVWAVGADAGNGPMVLHFDGAVWEERDAGITGDLWWVHGFADGPVYMGGSNGQIVRYQDGTFTPMVTPGTGVVFGIWGASPDDVWAVGGAAGGASGAFAWRLDTTTEEWLLAPELPIDIADAGAFWKMHGPSAESAWIVGTNGLALRWDGTTLTREDIPTGESVFTVHSSTDRFVAVGGFGTGTIFENTGDGWADISPQGGEPLIGVYVNDAGGGYAVGQFATVLERTDDTWQLIDTETSVYESLHAVWMDPNGGVWAVGGQVQAFPLVRGVMLYRGDTLPGAL